MSHSALMMPMKEKKPDKTYCKFPMESIFPKRKNSNEEKKTGYSKYLLEDMNDIEEHHVSKPLIFTEKLQSLEEMRENSKEMLFSHQKTKKK